jgi:hypothetical protein
MNCSFSPIRQLYNANFPKLGEVFFPKWQGKDLSGSKFKTCQMFKCINSVVKMEKNSYHYFNEFSSLNTFNLKASTHCI